MAIITQSFKKQLTIVGFLFLQRDEFTKNNNQNKTKKPSPFVSSAVLELTTHQAVDSGTRVPSFRHNRCMLVIFLSRARCYHTTSHQNSNFESSNSVSLFPILSFLHTQIGEERTECYESQCKLLT